MSVEVKTKLEMTTGQAHELTLALDRHCWSRGDIKRLCEGDLLAQALSVVRGHGKVKLVIDCVAPAVIPERVSHWQVEYHDIILGSAFELDPSRIGLYLSKHQCGDAYIGGNELRKELMAQGLPVLNANVLDRLLSYSRMIPSSLEGKALFFWGTIYRNSQYDRFVRYLRLEKHGWDWNYQPLVRTWGSHFPAAIAIT